MTEIDYKVKVIVNYIFESKGVDIRDINLQTGEDLAKLNYAYTFAEKYFKEKAP